MAFDGITVAALRAELADTLEGGRIARVTQPEKDAALLTVKNNGHNYRLFLSASASLPFICLTGETRPSPAQAPAFCMLLRKYIGGGKILRIVQPGLERAVRIEIEHRNEMGDVTSRTLILEMMGKYSNLILVDENEQILDAIKRIPAHISSVREVLPGKPYFLPDTMHKLDPLTADEASFTGHVFSKPMPAAKAIYQSLTGISPLIAEEVCYRASIDGGISCDSLNATEKTHLFHTFMRIIEDVKNRQFDPTVYYNGTVPKEYSAIPLEQFSEFRRVHFDSMSKLITTFYAERERHTRIRQKSTDLRKIVSTLLERSSKKLNLQMKQLRDTEKREKFRVYGELLNTYGYSLPEGAKILEAVDYYTDKPVKIPLDPTRSASENAKHYFARYNKLKRTAEDLTTRTQQTKAETEHLDSINTALDLAETEEDLSEIREELAESGFIRKHASGRKKKRTSAAAPILHFISSDGYDMYVGKNNYQNETVSFHIASGDDWWFHAKKMPGSHVIVKSRGKGLDLPDRTFEEAARLAAYYSKGRQAPKTEVDYTLRKNLRKPTGGAPGFVVYYTNYSMMAEPDISGIRQADD